MHGGSSAGKSDLCCGHSLDVVGRPGLLQSGLMSLCFAGCFSPGPRKNDLTIYWTLGPFVRSFTLLVDPGDIYPPQEVLSAVPGVPKAALHQRWRNTTISFGAFDCTDNMAGAGVLPLITAPIVANMRLHHVLIDGGAGLNVISHATFKQLQIPGSRLGPSRPFFRVSPQPVYPLGSITLPVIFGTEENFRTENVQFDVTEVNLPFNAIIGRSALYRFMAIAHYGYLVLKMPSPIGVLSVRDDRTATLVAVEKLHALTAETAWLDDGGRSPSASGAKASKVQPTEVDGGPTKTIQVGADPSRTTRIAGNLGEKIGTRACHLPPGKCRHVRLGAVADA
jgi:hypothetical protein